jgi:hypothetical protein
MNIDREKTNPARRAFLLLFDRRTVESKSIRIANSQGFIESKKAAAITAGIVSFCLNLVISGSSVGELSEEM